MNYLLEHITQDIKGDKNIGSQQYIKLNTGAKEIQQVNPGGIRNFTVPRQYFFVDHLCYLCLVLGMLLRLFIAACGHLLGKG